MDLLDDYLRKSTKKIVPFGGVLYQESKYDYVSRQDLKYDGALNSPGRFICI